jgi:hypothetical protein
VPTGESAGKFLGRRPDFDIPDVPLDVTEWSDPDLMELFAKYVAWQNFVDSEVIAAERDEMMAENRLKLAEARAVASSSEKITKARLEAKSSQEVEQAMNAHVMAKSLRKALGIQQSALERAANFVSRELSRRIGRGPSERRNTRWNP